MSHQLEKNRKSSNMGTPVPSSFRRRFHGGLVMTFITLLLLATIVTLTWNYEGVQRLVKLVPTDGFSSWPNRPNTSPGDVHGTLYREAKKEDNQSKEESSKNKSAFQLDTIPQPLVVNLTILEGATKRGAVCLDGSPPGYHLHKGSGVNARNWVVFLEEGAWCESDEACRYRARARLGSSKWMESRTFEGILSNSEVVNPDFFNWNRVFVRYCDGASFSGNGSLPTDSKARALHFRGESIWRIVIDDLLDKGMRIADKALLGGCSAGGLSSILHCDKFKAALPKANVVKCMADAGFFVHMAKLVLAPLGCQIECDPSLKQYRMFYIQMSALPPNMHRKLTEHGRKTFKGENKIQTYFKNIVELQNAVGSLPKTCTQTREPTECFFPQYLLSQMETPLFIVNGAYDWWQLDNIVAPDPLGEWDTCKNNATTCTKKQMKIIEGYRKTLLEALKPIQTSKKHGMFIDGCFHHCQASYNAFWSGPHAPHVNNKTAAQALGEWYFERDDMSSNVYIDCAYPCNPTCPPRIDGRLSVGRPSFRNWSKRAG